MVGLLGEDWAGRVPVFSDYLASRIPGHNFKVIVYPGIDELVNAVNNNRIDFALITPVAYVKASEQHQLRTLATVTHETAGVIYPWLASAVFVRADRTDLQVMGDARGKSVLALSSVALGGWLAAMREWQQLGLQENDFRSLKYDFSYEAVLRGVCEGTVDLGVLPANILADMRNRCAMPLRVLPAGPVKDSSRYPVEASSRIYPEVAFVGVRIDDEKLINQMAIALLALERGSEAARAINVSGFTAPLKYDSVEALMRELRVAPFNNIDKQTLSEFLQENRGKLAVAMFLLAGVLVIAYISNVLLQRKVRQSEFLRTQIFSSSQFAVAVIDSSSLKFVEANEAAARLCGYDDAEHLKGYTPLQLASSDNDGESQVASSIAAIRRELRGGLRPLVFAWSLQRPNGERWDAEGHMVPFRWGANSFILVLLVDATEHNRILRDQERMQQQLQHVERLESIGRFSGAIAHDFNNLLTVINGYSELLLLNADPNDDHQHVYREISQACSRASELTNQLLTFSRRRMAKMEPLDVNKLIRDSAAIFQRLLGETVTMRTNLCDDHAITMADSGQLHQVLMNFVANARDAMPEGGTFTITTEVCRLDAAQAPAVNLEPGDYLKVQVGDTGIGMTQEVQAKIFEPFFTTKGERGTGFGLATAYGIIRQSHGNITFESMPGRGTTFTLYLPRTSASTRADDEPHSASLDGFNQLTVLLVEDEREVRSFASMVLQAAGCVVLAADSGAQAMALAHSRRGGIDLLFTDVVLGDISGIKLAQQLQPLLPGTPVLFTSGYANDEQSLGEMLNTRAGFIAKPYSRATLLAKIRALSGYAVKTA